MSDGLEKDQDPLDSNWLTQFENDCIENENDIRAVEEERITFENERASQKLWLSFQNSASSISKLYKGKTLVQGQCLLIMMTAKSSDFYL